jgi:hypothetical protein
LPVAVCASDASTRGKQEFCAQQSAQRLETLREHALIESAVSSNRIEDVLVDTSREQIRDAGRYEEDDGIIERDPDGHERVRFRPVPAAGSPAAIAGLVTDWE